MAEVFEGSLECDVTEYVPPQTVPAGAEVYGEVMEFAEFDEEFGRLKMLVKPITVTNAVDFNPDGPASAIPFYAHELSASRKASCVREDGTFNEKLWGVREGYMFRLKQAFGLGKTEQLNPRKHCFGKRVRFIVAEQYASKEKKEERKQQGLPQFTEVGKWLEVEGVERTAA